MFRSSRISGVNGGSQSISGCNVGQPHCSMGVDSGGNGEGHHDEQQRGATPRPLFLYDRLLSRHSQPERLEKIASSAYALLERSDIYSSWHDASDVEALAMQHLDLFPRAYSWSRAWLRKMRRNCPLSETVLAGLYCALYVRGGDLARFFLEETLFTESARPYRVLLREKLCQLGYSHRTPMTSFSTRLSPPSRVVQFQAAGMLIQLWNAEQTNTVPDLTYEPEEVFLPDILCRK